MAKKVKVKEISPEELSQAIEQHVVSLENLLEESKQEEMHSPMRLPFDSKA